MGCDETRDLNITHAVVNTLTAGYQGKFAALSAFRLLGSARFSQVELNATREALDRISVYIQALMRGEALLAGPGTESSPDRETAHELLDALAEDVSSLADELLRMRDHGYVADEPDQAALLVASFCRHAYARDHYVKGLVAYSEKFGYEDAADRWRQHLIHTPREIDLAHQYLYGLKDSTKADKKFHLDLFDETLLLPYIFRCQVQDINQVKSLYGEGFTYESAGIGPDEAAKWSNMNARPAVACYWHAYDFDPDEAAAWIKMGFFEPGSAANWKYRDFGPDEAERWQGADFSPRGAMVSKVTGHKDPETARAWLEAARVIQREDSD